MTGITGRQIRDGTIETVDLSLPIVEKLLAPLQVNGGAVDLGEELRVVGLGGIRAEFDDITNTLVIDGDPETPGVISYWADVTVPVTAMRQTSNNKPDFDVAENGYVFPNNSTAHILYFTIAMPTPWQINTTVYPMVHVHQTRSDAPGFALAYRWANVGGSVGAWTTVSLNTWLRPFTGGALHNVVYNAYGIQPPQGLEAGATLQCKLYRQGGSAYTDSIITTAFSLRHRCDALGFLSMLIK